MLAGGGPVPPMQRFDPRNLDPKPTIVGEGTIGGKARGFLFAREVCRREPFRGARQIRFPESAFIATGLFEAFLEHNGFSGTDWEAEDHEVVVERFSRASLPPGLEAELGRLVQTMPYPLAIRSSSRLEDDPVFSLAGKYLTTFIPNQGDVQDRVEQLGRALRLIYASTYNPTAVAYRRRHGLPRESMAVIVQQLVGRRRDHLFYPELAGVGFSRNFRCWSERIRPEHGMARVVFGLGTRCTGRGYARTISFSNPRLRPEGYNPRAVAKYSQETVDALDLDSGEVIAFNINERRDLVALHPLFNAFAQIFDARTGELRSAAGRTTDLRPEQRYVFSFPALDRACPTLVRQLRSLFEALEAAMATAVDVEFTFETAEDEFAVVQARPLSSWEEYSTVRVPEDLEPDQVLLRGDRMLTNGQLEDASVLVYVDPWAYEGAPDKYAVARAVGRVNQELAGRRYVLVGPGRWGSTNPQLGVPVRYHELANAGCIVELGVGHGHYTPELSYGTHFFADLDVDRILYLPVFDHLPDNVFNRAWFERAPHREAGHPAVRVYEGPLAVYLDGERQEGVVITRNQPEDGPRAGSG